ncbi:hypothetical protein GCM10009867_02190 [Pedococcus aerophilus]|uniref:Uncharacterized protein n=1 Tax=Pedococcus aerophilus TaxID=436356 RepID=A0ABN3UEU2_9MICO
MGRGDDIGEEHAPNLAAGADNRPDDRPDDQAERRPRPAEELDGARSVRRSGAQPASTSARSTESKPCASATGA